MSGIFSENGNELSCEMRDILEQLRARRITVDEAEALLLELASNIDAVLNLAFGAVGDLSDQEWGEDIS